MRIFFFWVPFVRYLAEPCFTLVYFISLHKFIFLHLVGALAYAGFLPIGLAGRTNFTKSLKIHAYILFGIFELSFFMACVCFVAIFSVFGDALRLYDLD